MNKKNPEQISSGSFYYLLNLGRVTSEFRLIAIDFSKKSPTSPCELSEREVTSPSNLKVVGALNNYSLVFVIFINFFGQLKDWVGQVLFLVSCPKGQVEKYVNVEAWSYPQKVVLHSITAWFCLTPSIHHVDFHFRTYKRDLAILTEWWQQHIAWGSVPNYLHT